MTRAGTCVEVLGTTQHACWDERVLPPVEQLAPWLWSVPVPIPNNPLRYTLCYILLGDDGPVVVDPGWDSAEGWAALTAGLTAADTTVSEVTGICLRDEDARLLLTGDHVLPRITPNIGLAPATDRPALADFLASLRGVARYDDHDVLPAHEYRFRGLAGRTHELLDHHERRCAEVLDAITTLGRPTHWQLAEQLTWSRPWSEVGTMRIGAVAETAAHVAYLETRGLVTRHATSPLTFSASSS